MASNLTRFDPFAEMARFEPFSNFDDFFRDFRMMPAWRNSAYESAIKLDVSESDDSYTIKADVPGVRKEDIKVEVDGSQVTISAEARGESDVKDGENIVRSERYYGRQYRSFSLPKEVDNAKADAKYEHGVLEVTLPKKAGGGGKQLKIH